MKYKILITGAFNDVQYKFSFFEKIASALESNDVEVHRFNSFGFKTKKGIFLKTLERLATLPARLLGFKKQAIKSFLPWTADGQRENFLLHAVKDFRPDAIIVISGFRHQARTLQACRKLGAQRLIGWFVEGPNEPGLPERESSLFDDYFCIHKEINNELSSKVIYLPSYGLDYSNFRRLLFPRRTRENILFVGTPTKRRIEFLSVLDSLPLEIWGPGWGKIANLNKFHRGEFIWGQELNALYNESAIILNISSWPATMSGMTQRIIEIPSSGAFMLTDESQEISNIFKIGVQIDTFSTPVELKLKCEYYLADSLNREIIASRGHEAIFTVSDFSVTAKKLIENIKIPVRASPT